MLLTVYLGDQENFPIFNLKTHQEIAEIAAENLGFEISQSTVRGIWQARIENNFEVWQAPLRKKKMSVADEIAGLKEIIKEQDQKFKIIFRKLHELSQSENPNFQERLNSRMENFHFNNGGGDGAELVD